MRIGVMSGATPGPDGNLEGLIARAKDLESRGFHSIWVPEHVVFFRDYASQYPYSEDGKIPGNPDGVMEPLTALTSRKSSSPARSGPGSSAGAFTARASFPGGAFTRGCQY